MRILMRMMRMMRMRMMMRIRSFLKGKFIDEDDDFQPFRQQIRELEEDLAGSEHYAQRMAKRQEILRALEDDRREPAVGPIMDNRSLDELQKALESDRQEILHAIDAQKGGDLESEHFIEDPRTLSQLQAALEEMLRVPPELDVDVVPGFLESDSEADAAMGLLDVEPSSRNSGNR